MQLWMDGNIITMCMLLFQVDHGAFLCHSNATAEMILSCKSRMLDVITADGNDWLSGVNTQHIQLLEFFEGLDRRESFDLGELHCRRQRR
jgi:hypothetical protein